jgi:NAD(P)-dependent dehydrogenase (short-subunit alcohol dehydrogenase family)
MHQYHHTMFSNPGAVSSRQRPSPEIEMTQRSPQTVIVTGASSGIGLAIAQGFLRRGDNVVGNARTLERLQAAGLDQDFPDKFLAVAGDIADPAAAKRIVAEAVARFGHVDVLVNNAGIFNAKTFTEYTAADIDALVGTNLKGFFYISQEAVRHMTPRKQGHIVNITASIALQPNASVPALLPILVKGGLNDATRALALELAPHNIQVNAVAPGIIDTPLYTPDMHGFLSTLQPAGRIGAPADIVDAVLYLSHASFTTGAVLPVDGGMSAGKW